MDLCCLLSKTPVNNNGKGKEKANENEKDQDSSSSSTPPSTSLPAPETRAASELVDILGQVIREETDFNVMPLPKARIPIIKISRPPTNELPYEISCDIGFENRLALENTRLLLSYAMVDPPRLRTLVLFLKVWTKRRKLNSPYTGTLSSYGYTLMVLFFLAQVKSECLVCFSELTMSCYPTPSDFLFSLFLRLPLRTTCSSESSASASFSSSGSGRGRIERPQHLFLRRRRYSSTGVEFSECRECWRASYRFLQVLLERVLLLKRCHQYSNRLWNLAERWSSMVCRGELSNTILNNL